MDDWIRVDVGRTSICNIYQLQNYGPDTPLRILPENAPILPTILVGDFNLLPNVGYTPTKGRR